MIVWATAYAFQATGDLPIEMPSIGIALGIDAGQTCLSFQGETPTPGDRVTLVDPFLPQSAVRGTLATAAPTCTERLGRATVDGPYFGVALETVPPSLLQRPWVALYPEATLSDRQDGRLWLSVGQSEVEFRSCVSVEGLHLTAWGVNGLAVRRLWHQYFYVGYDMEPTCGERDFE